MFRIVFELDTEIERAAKTAVLSHVLTGESVNFEFNGVEVTVDNKMLPALGTLIDEKVKDVIATYHKQRKGNKDDELTAID